MATKGATLRVPGADYDFDLDPVTFITVGTIGPPGQRTFYLQAAQGNRVVSLIIEKEHAAALALSIQRLLDSMGPEHGGTGETGKAGEADAPGDVAPDSLRDSASGHPAPACPGKVTIGGSAAKLTGDTRLLILSPSETRSPAHLLPVSVK